MVEGMTEVTSQNCIVRSNEVKAMNVGEFKF